MYPIPEFAGPFKDELANFIKHKRSLGHDYGYGMIKKLSGMNCFLLKHGITHVEIPESAYMGWIQLRCNETTSTQEKRYCAIHGFARFLISRGYKNIFDTENHVIKRCEFTPYIYTEDEIVRIFAFADRYHLEHKHRNFDCGSTMPVLLRMLYSTGMRISEALSLRLADIDIESGTITLLDSKNHVSRYIGISASMKSILNNYILKLNAPITIYSYLFHGRDGSAYKSGTVRKAFHCILDGAGIKRRPSGKYPRLHDFRFLFTVRSLEQMVEKGYDLYTSLPILCKYLGHKGIIETEYYIRLTKDRYSQITDAALKHAPDLFPGMEAITYE